MGNFARKIIDAVQNTLLDKLLARLFALAPVALLALRPMQDDPPLDLVASVVALVVLGGIAMWVIGFIANRRPRPTRTGPLDKLHETPPNGFAAWSELPEKGLRPYRPVLAVIRILGAAPNSRVLDVLTYSTMMAAMLFIIAAVSPRDPLFDALASPWVQARLVPGLAMMIAVLTFRIWATEQRIRFEPALKPAAPTGLLAALLNGLILLWISAAVGLAATMMFGWPVQIALAVAAAIAVICALSPLREPISDALFGKKITDDLPDRGTP